MTDGLQNLIRREVARCMARFAHPVAGIISSFDPVTQSVKVRYQPEDTLSGWIPLNTPGGGASGFTAGIAIGPHVGQALIIGFLEGDRESPFVMARMFTDSEIPPAAGEGDIRIRHESGTRINFGIGSIAIVEASALVDGARIDLPVNGSVTVHDKSGAGIAIDGTGAITVAALAGKPLTLSANGSSLVIDASGNMTLTLAAGMAMQVAGAAGAGVSIDGSGNCLVNGASVLLGGSGGTKKVALDGDPVVGGLIQASSTLVRAK